LPTAVAVMPHVKSGKLRAIAVTSAKRLPSLPDVPTVAETLPGFEAVSWGGVMAPAGTPPEIIAKLNSEINRIIKLPDVSEKLQGLGAEIVGSTPAELAKHLADDIERYRRIVKLAGITAQ